MNDPFKKLTGFESRDRGIPLGVTLPADPPNDSCRVRAFTSSIILSRSIVLIVSSFSSGPSASREGRGRFSVRVLRSLQAGSLSFWTLERPNRGSGHAPRLPLPVSQTDGSKMASRARLHGTLSSRQSRNPGPGQWPGPRSAPSLEGCRGDSRDIMKGGMWVLGCWEGGWT